MNGVAACSPTTTTTFGPDMSMDDRREAAAEMTDDEHIYTNVEEINAMNNRPEPPTPDVADQPRRTLKNGWLEYMTDTGRSYFFHSETGYRQWEPPRMRAPTQVDPMLFFEKKKENLKVEEIMKASVVDEPPLSNSPTSNQSEKDKDEDFDEVADDSPVPPQENGATTPDKEKDPWVMKTPPPPAPSTFSPQTPSSAHNRSRSSGGPGSASKTVVSEESPTASQTQRMSVRLPASKSSTLPFQQIQPSVPPPSVGAVHVLPPVPSTQPQQQQGVPLPVGTPPVSNEYMNYEPFKEAQHFVSEAHGGNENVECGEETLARRTSQSKKIRCGTVEKCDGEAKKREWMQVFLFLSPAHLILYKDEKSAERHGKHFEAPLEVWDLRGAMVSYVPEKEKKKKRIIQASGMQHWIRTGNERDTQEWLDALRDVINALPSPAPGAMSSSATTGSFSQVNPVTTVITSNVTLTRHPSAGASSRPLSAAPAIGRSARTASTKHKADPMSSSAYVGSSSELHGEEQTPTKESIISRLKRFFRTRPTVESLKEKGIYKPEPVFGSTLGAICKTEHSTVPKFIIRVTELIEKKGLDTDGLYRVSGNLSAVQKIRCQIDQDKYSALENEDDVHVLTGALKLFFRELADPIFPYSMTKDFLAAIQIQNPSKRMKRFDELLKALAPENRETLRALLGHLNLVASHAGQNRMQVHNLAIVFGPALFGTGEEKKRKENTGTNRKKKEKRGGEEERVVIQSNSHLAFDMIMQGQIAEYLLKESQKFECLRLTSPPEPPPKV